MTVARSQARKPETRTVCIGLSLADSEIIPGAPTELRVSPTVTRGRVTPVAESLSRHGVIIVLLDRQTDSCWAPRPLQLFN